VVGKCSNQKQKVKQRWTCGDGKPKKRQDFNNAQQKIKDKDYFNKKEEEGICTGMLKRLPTRNQNVIDQMGGVSHPASFSGPVTLLLKAP